MCCTLRIYAAPYVNMLISSHVSMLIYLYLCRLTYEKNELTEVYNKQTDAFNEVGTREHVTFILILDKYNVE